MPASSVTTVAGLNGVAAAAGGLTLNNRTISGTVPAININSGGGGGFGGGGVRQHRAELPGQLHHQ